MDCQSIRTSLKKDAVTCALKLHPRFRCKVSGQGKRGKSTMLVGTEAGVGREFNMEKQKGSGERCVRVVLNSSVHMRCSWTEAQVAYTLSQNAVTMCCAQYLVGLSGRFLTRGKQQVATKQGASVCVPA